MQRLCGWLRELLLYRNFEGGASFALDPRRLFQGADGACIPFDLRMRRILLPVVHTIC
jgi:hypothetical protein